MCLDEELKLARNHSLLLLADEMVSIAEITTWRIESAVSLKAKKTPFMGLVQKIRSRSMLG